MNKKIVWAGIGIVVVALGAWAVFGGVAERNEEEASRGTIEESEKQSLKAILASGGSHKCEFEDETSIATTAGTVYIADGTMRGDFSATTDGNAFIGHMIAADNVIYTWMDGVSTGVKLAFDAEQKDEALQGLDMDKELNYHCESWSAESSKFVLPSDVTFTELGASASGSVSGTAAQCSACDSAGAYKDQCRAALGCKNSE